MKRELKGNMNRKEMIKIRGEKEKRNHVKKEKPMSEIRYIVKTLIQQFIWE